MSDNKVGKREAIDKIYTRSVTASGTVTLLPESPLGRRTYIKVKNIGNIDVAIVSHQTMSPTDGYIVDASGGEYDAITNAPLYIVSTGADSEVRVYELAKVMGYKWNQTQ